MSEKPVQEKEEAVHHLLVFPFVEAGLVRGGWTFAEAFEIFEDHPQVIVRDLVLEQPLVVQEQLVHVVCRPVRGLAAFFPDLLDHLLVTHVGKDKDRGTGTLFGSRFGWPINRRQPPRLRVICILFFPAVALLLFVKFVSAFFSQEPQRPAVFPQSAENPVVVRVRTGLISKVRNFCNPFQDAAVKHIRILVKLFFSCLLVDLLAFKQKPSSAGKAFFVGFFQPSFPLLHMARHPALHTLPFEGQA
jgi:hypothetical protein